MTLSNSTSKSCSELVQKVQNLSLAAESIDMTSMNQTLLQLSEQCVLKALNEEKDLYGGNGVVAGCTISATLVLCTCLMAADLWRGISQNMYWFPTKYFSLNKLSLVLIPAAVKVALDSATPMYTQVDNTTRYANMAVIITFLANAMPSLASKGMTGFLTIMFGVGFLVINFVYHICQEVITGLIDSIAVAFVCLLVSQFLIILCYAIKNPSCNRFFKMKYRSSSKRILNDENGADRFSVESLTGDVESHWVMVEACDPQYVLSTDRLSLVSGVICVTNIAIYLYIALKLLVPNYFDRNDVNYRSWYGWSSLVVLVTSSIGIVVGSIAPVLRVLKCKPLMGLESLLVWDFAALKIENYWTDELHDWKHSPLPFQLHDRRWRRRVYRLRIVLVNILLLFILAILFATTWSVFFPVSMFLKLIIDQFKKITSRREGGNEELSRDVLLLERKFSIDREKVTRDLYYIRGLIRNAREKQDDSFIEFLRLSNSFEGIQNLDIIPNGYMFNVDNGWSLPVITLTSIAMALPNVNEGTTDRLLKSVQHGHDYTIIVEKCFNRGLRDTKIQETESQLWDEVECNCTWLGITLKKTHYQGKTSRQILQWFSDKARDIMVEVHGRVVGDPNEVLPHKLLVANLMYRIVNALIHLDVERNLTHEELFLVLVRKIADILVACLTNIPQVIKKKLSDGTPEEQRYNVKVAAQLLGSSVYILELLSQRDVPHMNIDEMAFIDNWRSFLNRAQEIEVI